MQDLVLQSGQGELQVAQLESAVKQIAAFAQVHAANEAPHSPPPLPSLCVLLMQPASLQRLGWIPS